MEKAKSPNVFDIEGSCGLRALGRGTNPSKVNETLKGSIDIGVLLGKLRQYSWTKSIYDSGRDEKPLVQSTKQGEQEPLGFCFPRDCFLGGGFG